MTYCWPPGRRSTAPCSSGAASASDSPGRSSPLLATRRARSYPTDERRSHMHMSALQGSCSAEPSLLGVAPRYEDRYSPPGQLGSGPHVQLPERLVQVLLVIRIVLAPRLLTDRTASRATLMRCATRSRPR